MEPMECMRQRHSVRSYDDRPISADVLRQLREEIAACNREGGLHIQLVTDEPKAFDSFMAHYGKFSGVRNYLALVGKKGADLDEKCGYYGERLALKAQQLGLNTCWVALTHGRSAAVINSGEKQVCIIALGYGENQGVEHKSKALTEVSNYADGMPNWFRVGIEAAMLAPTAMNQQKFRFELTGDGDVKASTGSGFYAKVDLGIVKYHFELASEASK